MWPVSDYQQRVIGKGRFMTYFVEKLRGNPAYFVAD
jgi:hypothetical protein